MSSRLAAVSAQAASAASIRPSPSGEAAPFIAADSADRRIFVDNADYDHQNMGDLAMLQASLRRMAAIWPAASLCVMTQNPGRLGDYCSAATPVSCEGRRQWFAEHEPFARAWMALPSRWATAAQHLKSRLRSRNPGVLASALRLSRRRSGLDTVDLDGFVQALYSASFMVVTGAGGITDHARGWATRALDLLEIGIRRGLPTAMFGHGLGPLTDPALIERARFVLPRLSLLALREGRFGPAMALKLGVDPSRMVVTGDDALELPVETRVSAGQGLGVNLRLSPSSGLGENDVAPIRAALATFLRFRRPSVFPIPIAFNERLVVSAGRPVYSDERSIRVLLEGLAELPGSSQLNSPDAVIRRIGQCRVVVTGAYHAAVFALGLGIPVVCLAASNYFEQKFLGLAHQFGPGAWVVRVDAKDCESQISIALGQAWEGADELREPLRAAARQQVAAGREAYRTFGRLVEGRTF